jgi:hypothetical protein
LGGYGELGVMSVTDTQIDVDGWSKWLEEHRTIGSTLRGANSANKEAYFLTIHAATEAMLRKILLVGLRLNKVTYDEASDWLFHYDKTPNNVDFPGLFNKLYQSKKITWSALICSNSDLKQLWDLWLGYSKVLRNHISHGIRKYTDDWLECGITIDQELLIRLDQELSVIIGGSISDHLTRLNPRLPIGSKGINLKTITSINPRKPKPKISLVNTKIAIQGLTPRIS